MLASTEQSSLMPKVGFVSLGCPKNLVDSEVMMGILARDGYELTPRADEADFHIDSGAVEPRGSVSVRPQPDDK